jgi:hypothetical protein
MKAIQILIVFSMRLLSSRSNAISKYQVRGWAVNTSANKKVKPWCDFFERYRFQRFLSFSISSPVHFFSRNKKNGTSKLGHYRCFLCCFLPDTNRVFRIQMGTLTKKKLQYKK